jgi:glycosyltransferase involved in cell wall biosynthesis
MDQDLLEVSVVVCTYTERRWNELLAALDSVLTQVPRPAQLLLAVDHNPVLAARVRDARPNVSVLESTDTPGVSGARNTGLRSATQPITVYLDDDTEARPGWLRALVAPLREPNVVGTAGSVQPLWPRGRPKWLPPEFDWVVGCNYEGLNVSQGSVRNPIGGNMSVRTRAALEAGGFDASLGHVGDSARGGEETDLAIRVTSRQPGSVFRYVPEAVVDHHVEPDRIRWGYFVRRCWHEGASKVGVVQVNGLKGLESERTYVSKTLPAAMRRELLASLSGDPSGLSRFFAIVVGLAATVAGYLAGRLALVGRRLNADART